MTIHKTTVDILNNNLELKCKKIVKRKLIHRKRDKNHGLGAEWLFCDIFLGHL